MMLADMGADVIRVDRARAGGGSKRELLMGNEGMVDRGRRSIAVDLKSAEGIELVLDLVAGADVLVEGYRPQVMERLGLGPEPCLERNPRLVYARSTGWGQSGPWALTAGHDINYIALSGALYSLGYPDRPPTPPLALLGDYAGGMFTLAGVLAALLDAKNSGLGQVVDSAMADSAINLMTGMYGARQKGLWSERRYSNIGDGASHFYTVYECADGGFISVGAIEPQFYRVLLEKVGLEDPDADKQLDEAVWSRLQQKLGSIFKTRARDEWAALFDGSDACVAPVLSMAEAHLHPHNVARQTFIEVEGVVQPAPAPRFDRTPSGTPEAAPSIGANTRDILQMLGHEGEEIERLIAAGTVYAAGG